LFYHRYRPFRPTGLSALTVITIKHNLVSSNFIGRSIGFIVIILPGLLQFVNSFTEKNVKHFGILQPLKQKN